MCHPAPRLTPSAKHLPQLLPAPAGARRAPAEEQKVGSQVDPLLPGGLPRPRVFKYGSLRIMNEETQGQSCNITEFVTHQHRLWEGVHPARPSEVLLPQTECSSRNVLLSCPCRSQNLPSPPQVMPEWSRERGSSCFRGSSKTNIFHLCQAGSNRVLELLPKGHCHPRRHCQPQAEAPGASVPPRRLLQADRNGVGGSPGEVQPRPCPSALDSV